MVPHDTNDVADIFWVNLETGRVRSRIVSLDGGEADGAGYGPAISDDGHYVAFASDAHNLVPNDAGGLTSICIAGDSSTGADLVQLTDQDGTALGEHTEPPVISGDGRYVAFVSAISSAEPEYLFIGDRLAGTVVAEVLAWNGEKPNLAWGSNMLSHPSISSDGAYIAFESDSTNLLPANDTNGCLDIYIANRSTARVATRIVASDGAEPNGHSDSPSITPDGRYLVFYSVATNLVPDDTNDAGDVFVADMATGKVLHRVVAYDGSQPDGETE